MSGYLNKAIKVRGLADFGRAVDIFNKDNGVVDMLGRIRTTYKATVSLEAEGVQIFMTSSAGDWDYFIIPWAEIADHADTQFTPAQCRQLLEAFARKLKSPLVVPSDILIPKHFTGM